MKIKEKKLKIALKIFTEEMAKRLAKKEEEGYEGWDDNDAMPDIYRSMLLDVVNYSEMHVRGMLIDIANRAMMLYYRKDVK